MNMSGRRSNMELSEIRIELAKGLFGPAEKSASKTISFLLQQIAALTDELEGLHEVYREKIITLTAELAEARREIAQLSQCNAGHVFMWESASTNKVNPPQGTMCRCGAVTADGWGGIVLKEAKP
jgi:hypothetical protein